MLTAQITVAAAFGDHAAAQDIAVLVLIGRFPQGTPTAHITPTGIERQHRTQRRALHHSHIKGHRWALGKGFALQPQELQIRGVVLQGRAAAAHQFRSQALQLSEHGASAEQEHAAVPGEATTGQKLLGGGAIGLLHKAGNRHRRGGIEGLRRFDVAIARLGGRGHDAEGHQAACFRRRNARFHRGAELLGFTDDVIGRQHQQQRILTASGGAQCRHTHRRSGVAAHRFQED